MFFEKMMNTYWNKKNSKNKKGFTLIEMLVVIAVIAILVSIVIPTVTGSTDKAAAATNAANLRSVEGAVVTQMLMNPNAFGDQAGQKSDLEDDLAGKQQESEELKTARAAVTAAEGALTDANAAVTALEGQKAEYLTRIGQLEAAAQTAQQELDNFNPNDVDAKKELDKLEADLEAKQGELATLNASNTHNGCSTMTIMGKEIHRPSTECGRINAEILTVNGLIAGLEASKPTLVEAANKAIAAAQKTLQDAVDNAHAALEAEKETGAGFDAAIETAKAGVTEAENAVKAAEARVAELEEENKEAIKNINTQLGNIGKFTASGGKITLPDGSVIDAPTSKAVDKDGVKIGKGVEMTIYVNNIDYTAYAYYVSEDNAEYGINDFVEASK